MSMKIPMDPFTQVVKDLTGGAFCVENYLTLM